MAAIAGWAVRHARSVLVVAALLALGAAVAATQLSTDAGTDTLVDRGSESYQATERVREVFGEEPVVVVAQGDLQELILTPNLGRLLRLEGCLSGKVPKGAKPIPGPCTELAEMDPVQFLAGPGHLPQRGGDPDRRTAGTAGGDRAARPAARIPRSGGRPLRDHQRAQHRQPRIPRRRGLRPAPLARDPEVEARLPLPQQPHDPDRPPPAPRPQRCRTQSRLGLDPRSRLRHHARARPAPTRASPRPASPSTAAPTRSPARRS